MEHLVVRPVLDVRLRTGGGPDRAVLDRLDALWHERLVPVLEAAFDAAAGPDDRVRIERLELDLGTVRPEGMDEALAAALRAALARELPAARADRPSAPTDSAGHESSPPALLPDATEGQASKARRPGHPAAAPTPAPADRPGPDSSPRTALDNERPGAPPEAGHPGTEAAATAGALAAFLRTGRLPWWAAGPGRFDLDAAVADALAAGRLAPIVAAGGPRALRRLAWQASPATVRSVAGAWAPDAPALDAVADAWRPVGRALADPAAVDAALRVAVLAAARPALAAPLAPSLAGQAPPGLHWAHTHAVEALAEAAGRDVPGWAADAVADPAADAAPAPVRTALHRAAGLAAPDLASGPASNDDAPGGALADRAHLGTHAEGAATDADDPGPGAGADSIEDDPGTEAAPVAPDVAPRPAPTTDARPPRPPDAPSGTGAEPPALPGEPGEEPTPDDVRRGVAPLSPADAEFARDATEAAAPPAPADDLPTVVLPTDDTPDDGEPLYVRDAGLVLLAPFLPAFFDAVGLLDDRRTFASAAAQRRAVGLAAGLASGRTVHAESDLVLAKLLCGVPLAVPVEPEHTPTEAERTEATALLEAVVAHWAALGSTSPEGLRATFLARDGRLERGDDAWRLAVERRGVDVLVDAVPWAVGLVALPWMDRPLHVTW